MLHADEIVRKIRHRISFRLFEFSWDPAQLSDAFDWQPFVTYTKGQPRFSRTGKPLPVVRDISYWCGVEDNDSEPDLSFYAHVADIVAYVEEPAGLVAGIIRDGGRADVTIDLPGDVAMGDTLTPAVMIQMAGMGIDLDVEVFPHMP